MDIDKIENYIKLMNTYGLSELEITESTESIKLKYGSPQYQSSIMSPIQYQAPNQQVSKPTANPFSQTENSEPDKHQSKKEVSKNTKEIKSPFVGTFYGAPSPEASNFVEIGQTVKKGQTLCIVEAMKLMNEIESEFDGVIKDILVKNEQAIEFDQAIFHIETRE